MNFTINNGSRKQVSFGEYSGKAGVVTHEGVTRVSFFGDYKLLRDVKVGLVEGSPVTVLSVDKSDPERLGVKGMVVLTVQAAP